MARDDELATQLKLKISADRNLPDIILVDLGDGKNGGMVLVFVEVVATDGPVTALAGSTALAEPWRGQTEFGGALAGSDRGALAGSDRVSS